MLKIKTNRHLLAEARIKQGMSGKALAGKVGVAHSFLYGIETGKSNPGPATAKKISEALNVPYGELFTIVEGG